jgi:tRNA(Arg) A34 adenosine deaminase TadA
MLCAEEESDMDDPIVSTKRRTFLRHGVAGSVALAANIAAAQPRRVEPARESAVTDRDREVMRQLVAFTRKSFSTPHPIPFGSVVVRSGESEPVARLVNQVGALKDPTAHAEMQAIRAACKELASMSLAGCTLYTTAEPCAMCMGAALWAELDRVVYGATIDDVGRHISQMRFPARDLLAYSDHACQVAGPAERAACNALFDDPVMAPIFRAWKKR